MVSEAEAGAATALRYHAAIVEPGSTGGVEAPPTTKAAHRLMREVNRTLVLDALRQGGEMSRVELARRTRLSKPTVSSIVDLLIKEGTVLEVGMGRSQPQGGRPPALLVYNETRCAYAGIQLGGHLTHVAVADGLGRLLAEDSAEAPRDDPPGAARQAVRLLRRVLARERIALERVGACGVAVAGPADEALRDPVERALGVPVVVVNATAAATVAEGRLGRAVGQRSYAYLHAGRSVEAGIVLEGRLLPGRSGLAGGLGHCAVVEDGPACRCGNRGCLEAVASADAVTMAATEALRAGAGGVLSRYRRALDGAVIAQAADEGDELARRLVRDAGLLLGRGLAYLLNLLDLGMVVVGGPLVRAGEVYVDAVREGAAGHAPAGVPAVEAALLSTQAPMLGVVQLALEHGTPSYRIVGRRAS
jgi:predicted NBD/HSP70 family sugar kinase